MISTMPNVYFSHEICRVCEMPISISLSAKLSAITWKTNYVSFMSYNIDLGIYMKIYMLK